MSVLVTGGAGYIGSHAVRQLVQADRSVVVVDNLARGHRAAVHPAARFFQVDLRETERLAEIMAECRVESVMHFAALAYVGESVEEPLRYYHNNTGGSVSLLQAMVQAGVRKLVFSSTCATYGIPETLPIVETTPQHPVNPYGASKLFVERILRDYAFAHPDFSFVALRYFNVAGCSHEGALGEDHHPETHLIPVAIQAALGRRDRLKLFGADYDTPDGTCIRDYVHVEDLCAAHILALDALASGEQRFYNLGIGHGYSVREVIDAVQRVLGCEVPVEPVPRRPGDPPCLVANADLARRELRWEPRYTELDAIVETAARWFEDHPNGYGDYSGTL